MGKTKRKGTAIEEFDVPTKRSRSAGQTTNFGRIDPTFGQRSALPGFDDYTIDIEDTYIDNEEETAALSYLRSVREEASSLPIVLSAPRQTTLDAHGIDRSIYENGIGDSRGLYHDGVYFARTAEAASSPPTLTPEIYSTRDPQLVYFEKIIRSYNALKENLSQTPPRHAVERLDDDHGFYLAPRKELFRKWRWRMMNTDPEPAQLASLQVNAVFKLVELLTANAFLRNDGITERTSRWIWGLLSRVPPSGELHHEQIGVLRRLAEKAGQAGRGSIGEMKGQSDVLQNEEEEEVVDMEVIELDKDLDGDQDEEEEEAVDLGLFGCGTDRGLNGKQHDILTDYDDGNEDVDGIAGVPQHADDQSANGEHLVTSAEGNTFPKEVNIINVPSSSTFVEKSGEDDFDEEIAAARKALLARISKDDEETANLEDEYSEGGVPIVDATDSATILANTKATVDMIYTIVAELYGQKDLLRCRERWT